LVRRLEEALRRRFPREDIKTLSEVLSFAAKKRKIRYEEITVREDEKLDILLFLEKERLLLPSKTSKSLAWEDRELTPKLGEEYEMPNVIIHLIKKAEETGEWNPNYAVKRYMEDIGEPEAEKILELLNRVKEKAEGKEITPEILEEVSGKLGLRSKLGRIIAELKGGGIISPCLRRFIQRRSVLYEINPSLY